LGKDVHAASVKANNASAIQRKLPTAPRNPANTAVTG